MTPGNLRDGSLKYRKLGDGTMKVKRWNCWTDEWEEITIYSGEIDGVIAELSKLKG